MYEFVLESYRYGPIFKLKAWELAVLGLTKKTGYGLIALAHLAKLEDGRLASAAQIARTHGVPKALLMNVLKELSAAGYVESIRGAGGGYRLALPPERIVLSDLVEAVERPVLLAECVTKMADHSECTPEMMACCPVADPVHRFHRLLNDFLRRLTLADLLTSEAMRSVRVGARQPAMAEGEVTP